jgi:predicted MPP superfamily phosphohydrolase
MEAATGLVVTDYRLSPPDWPADRRLTIAVIADLHAGGPNMGLDRVRQVVDSANVLGCDLVVLLGDYFATHRFVTGYVPPPAWGAELARLRAPLGVYAIYGNHDWWYDIAGVRNAFMNARIPAIQNEAILLGERGNRFWLAGLGDQLGHYISPGRFRGVDDLPATLARVTTDDPLILLVHKPDISPASPSASRSRSPVTPMADRCEFRWCRRSGPRRNTVLASRTDTSSSVAAI